MSFSVQAQDDPVVAPVVISSGVSEVVEVLTAEQVSDTCYQWIVDEPKNAGTWDRSTWSHAPTGNEVYWDSAADGARYAFTITEDPGWGTPVSATYSWYRFKIGEGSGGSLVVETVIDGHGTGTGWAQPSGDMSATPSHHTVSSAETTVNGGIIYTNGGEKLGWDELKLVKCYQAASPSATPMPTSTPQPTATPLPTSTPLPTATAIPTATPSPTATAMPTATPLPTLTPTPCPTLPPQPTATAMPDNPQIVVGPTSCRSTLWLPSIAAETGNAQQSCLTASAANAASAVSMELAALSSCLPIPAQIASVCQNPTTEWAFERQGQQKAVRISCQNAQLTASAVGQDVGTLTWVVPIALPALSSAAVTAFLVANAPIIIGVVIVGGVAYMILSADDAPVVTFDGSVFSAESQAAIDAWLLMQNEGYINWPKGALRVSTAATLAVAWYQDVWDDNKVVSLVPASTHRQNGSEVMLIMALTSARELVSYQLVEQLNAGETALVQTTAAEANAWSMAQASPRVVTLSDPEGFPETQFVYEAAAISWQTAYAWVSRMDQQSRTPAGLLLSVYVWEQGVRVGYYLSTEKPAVPLVEEAMLLTAAAATAVGQRYRDIPLPDGFPQVDPHEGPDPIGRSAEELATRMSQRAPGWALVATTALAAVANGKPPCDWLGYAKDRDQCYCACYTCMLEAAMDGVKNITGFIQIFSGQSGLQNTAIPLGSGGVPKNWTPGDNSVPPRSAQYQETVVVKDPITREPVVDADGNPVTRPGPKTVDQKAGNSDFDRCNQLMNNMWSPAAAQAAGWEVIE